jgi:hypothetical protein
MVAIAKPVAVEAWRAKRRVAMMLIFIVNTLLTLIYELGSGRLPSKSRNTQRERVSSRPRPRSLMIVLMFQDQDCLAWR